MPFLRYDVVRGQSRGLNKGFFSFFSRPKTDESGEITNKKSVGFFKGRVTVENKEDKDEMHVIKLARNKIIIELIDNMHQKKFGAPLDFQMKKLESFEGRQKFQQLLEKMRIGDGGILNFLKEQSYEDKINKMLVARTKCLVRLYVIEGYDFAQRDIGSFSDPYLKIKCGKKKFNERDNYMLDEPNPKFYKCYEFDAEFPGASPVIIKAYDFDDLFGDDLIGKTVIDLDDRYFSPEWQSIKDKPIEYRELYHESTTLSQGVIKLWVEIHQTNNSTKMDDPWDISMQPVNEYEVRTVIWGTKDVICTDVEGTSDVFCKAFIDNEDQRETDTHYRCSNGRASFNYRLLFPVKAPRDKYNLSVQLWDRDLFKKNDFIGSAELDLADVFKDAIDTKKAINLNKKYWDSYLRTKMPGVKLQFEDDESFWVDCMGVGKKGDLERNGSVRISVGVYPKEMAVANPVGTGRSEPNHSPFLPPPVGRIKFSLNPIANLVRYLVD